MEGVCSLLRRGPLADMAFTDEHLDRGLSHIQRHPELIDGCLTETGLLLHQPSPIPTEECYRGLANDFPAQVSDPARRIQRKRATERASRVA